MSGDARICKKSQWTACRIAGAWQDGAMLLTASLALAGTWIAAVGSDHTLAVGGNWARAFPAESGWHFLWAAGGDYNLLPMSEDLVVTDVDRRRLTGRSDLIDSQIVQCPDGTYLHVASAEIDQPDDSAYAFRYDADFDRLASGTLGESLDDMRMNDPAIHCGGGGLDLVGVVRRDFLSVLYELDGGVTPAGQANVFDWPMMQGGAIAYDEERGDLVALGYNLSGGVSMVRAGLDYQVTESRELPLEVGDERPYWPQGLLKIGDYWLVAHMSRNSGDGWSADEGNVRLAVFDEDWTLMEAVAISNYSPPTGAMRPGLALKGDRLLVLFDRALSPHVVPVTLDLAAFDAPDDTGGGDSDPPTDDTGPGGDDTGTVPDDTDGPRDDDPGTFGGRGDDQEGCGCSGTGAGPSLGLGLLAAAAARRRRRA